MGAIVLVVIADECDVFFMSATDATLETLLERVVWVLIVLFLFWLSIVVAVAIAVF